MLAELAKDHPDVHLKLYKARQKEAAWSGDQEVCEDPDTVVLFLLFFPPQFKYLLSSFTCKALWDS